MKIQISINGEDHVVDLSEEQILGLQRIARHKGISFPEAVLQAIEGGNFLEAVQEAGGKVLVEKDNQLREVVKEPQVA